MASEKKAFPFAGSFTPGEIYDVKAEELNKIAVDITLDPDTVNYHLTLSEGNKKATYGAWQRYTPRPERFDTQPQVMARDGLQGIHYWEVDWSESPKESVYVGVAYGSINRKAGGSDSDFGFNPMSWTFGKVCDPSWSEPKLRAWHEGLVWEGTFPSGGCKRVGVYLDWHKGTLYFSKVSGTQRVALYRFGIKFTEPVYPCLRLGQCGDYAALRPAS